MNRSLRFVQQAKRFFIAIACEQSSLYRGEESAEGTVNGIYSGGFIAAVNHAIGAGWVAGLGAVVAPIRGRKKFGESFGVAILEQIAGLLPSENVVGGHAPGCAGIGALAH